MSTVAVRAICGQCACVTVAGPNRRLRILDQGHPRRGARGDGSGHVHVCDALCPSLSAGVL